MAGLGVSAAPASGTAAAPARSRRFSRTLPRIDGSRLLFAAVIVASALGTLVAGESRIVLLPVLAMLICMATYVAVLYRRDRRLPLFEPASFAVAATVVYGAYPLVNFIAGGLRWTPFSDSRLARLAVEPKDVAAFGWRYVLYLAAFVVAYLLIRGAAGVRTTAIQRPSRATTISIVLTALLSWGFLTAIGRVFDFHDSFDYADFGTVRTISNLPHFVAQITQNVSSIQLLLWQLVVALLLLRWREHVWARLALVGLLLFVAVGVLVTRGSRSQLILLLMATALFYHRLVKPLKLLLVTAAGSALLAAFLGLGIVRDFRGADEPVPLLTASNEFQSLLGTPFDLRERIRTGEIVEIPWQVYWSDLLALVPSQLLPFEKDDGSSWYLRVAGFENVGFVFGVMAQAVVGRDWLELALRGAALALVLALLQRWYVRHVQSFWPTMLMMYLSVWMYYTIRQSTFSFLYVVMYRFLPTFLFVEVLRLFLRRTARHARAASASASRLVLR